MHRRQLAPIPPVAAIAVLLAALFGAPGPLIQDARATLADASEPAQALRAAELALDPDQEEPSSPAPTLEPTLALHELALALPRLRGEERRSALELLKRPVPGEGQPAPRLAREAIDSPICEPRFCVHWSEWGRDAPASPAFIDRVVSAMRRSIEVQNGHLGWAYPKSDGKKGGKNGIGEQGQIDVYVVELGRAIYGYAAPDPGQSGMRRHGYLVIDNDYAGFPGKPAEAIKATIAHEYNHILQFGYDSFQDLWLFEATAVWMEEKVYPGLDEYIAYLRRFAARAATPITASGMKMYGAGVWNHWLADRYDADVVRRTWEVSPHAGHFAIAAYDRAIAELGGVAFWRDFASFAVAGAEWATTSLPDASRYPSMKRRRTLRRAGARGRAILDHTSSSLINVAARRRNLKLVVKTRRGVRAAIALVGRRGPVARGRVVRRMKLLPRGGRGVVRLRHARRYDRVTAVIVNADGRTRGWRKGGKRTYHSDGSRFRFRLAR